MKHLLFILGVLATLIPAHAQPASSAASGRATASVADAEALLLESFRARNLPGAAAIVIKDGEVRFVVYGNGAGAEPVTPRTRFYIASLSKAFTAAAVLQLAERGTIDIDAPLKRYLPEFMFADPRAEAITVRHLLNQTSGLADIAYQEWRMPQPQTLRDLAPRMKSVRLVSNPGERFSYHNPNYGILARLVEVVSGQAFPAYMQDSIFGPLGMTNTTTVDLQDQRRDGSAQGHVYAFGRYIGIAAPKFFVNGAGGVLTTPEDYARWLSVQMNEGMGPEGVRILSADSIRAAQTPAATSGEYGFGWNRGNARVSHSGGLPTFGAYAAFEGRAAIAVFVSVVSVAAPSREIALGALDRLQGKEAIPVGADTLWWLDMVAAIAALLMWASSLRAIVRVRIWAQATRKKSVWRRMLAFSPHAIVIGGVLWGVPFLVSRLESWSWVWLWAYAPVWTTALLSAAAAAALVAGIRLVALGVVGRRDREYAG